MHLPYARRHRAFPHAFRITMASAIASTPPGVCYRKCPPCLSTDCATVGAGWGRCAIAYDDHCERHHSDLSDTKDNAPTLLHGPASPAVHYARMTAHSRPSTGNKKGRSNPALPLIAATVLAPL